MPLLISDRLRRLYTALRRNNNLEGQIGLKAKPGSFNWAHMHSGHRAAPVFPNPRLIFFQQDNRLVRSGRLARGLRAK